MHYQSLAIFTSVKDELVFYANEDNTSFYRSKKKICYLGEDLYFYAITRIVSKESPMEPALRDIFHLEDIFFEATSPIPDNNTKDRLLLLIEEPDLKILPPQSVIWKSENSNPLTLLEIDIEHTTLLEFPYYFSDSHEVLLCEVFEEIKIEELLDCEL